MASATLAQGEGFTLAMKAAKEGWQIAMNTIGERAGFKGPDGTWRDPSMSKGRLNTPAGEAITTSATRGKPDINYETPYQQRTIDQSVNRPDRSMVERC
jgi:hypothetical protein